MKRRPSYSPILNLQAFDMLEVSAVVGNYSQAFGFSCATNKKVEIFNLLARFPKLCSFLGKDMDVFIESNDLHLRNELIHLPKVIFYLLTIVCTKEKLCNNDFRDVAFAFVFLVEPILNIANDKIKNEKPQLLATRILNKRQNF